MEHISLFYEPREWFDNECEHPASEPEMTVFESAFLCGLVRERKPQKILEIGIAGGGTSAILLKCLEMIGMNSYTEVYSMDLMENFYRGTGECSGYLANDLLLREDIRFNHKFLLGKYLPDVIEEIGEGIDFVLLDTVHELPGELIDMLVVLPYLKEGACVVIHDIANNHYGGSPFAFATQVLLDVFVGDKIVPQDSDRVFGYPNIGAFVVNSDTHKYAVDAFNALLISWSYMIDDHQKALYTKSYRQNYGDEIAELFANICNMQSELQVNINKENEKRQIKRWETFSSSWTYRIGSVFTWLPQRIFKLCVDSSDCQQKNKL